MAWSVPFICYLACASSSHKVDITGLLFSLKTTSGTNKVNTVCTDWWKSPGKNFCCCATMYLHIETQCYSIDDRKSYQPVKKLETFPDECGERSPRNRLISPETPVTGVGNGPLYDDCAADHVISPSFRW